MHKILLSICLLSLCLLFTTSCGKETARLKQELQDKESQLQTQISETLQLQELVQKQTQTLKSQEVALQDQTLQLQNSRTEIEQLKVTLEEELKRFAEKEKAFELRLRRSSVPQASAKRILVIDPKTDEILYEKNADLRGPVASTQKLLTALLIVESGDLDRIVTIERSDTTAAPTRFGLKVGEQYTRRQLLTALLVRSFNDIAEALARDNAGSVAAFVKKMNQRAADLGMTNSNFENPHGLPNDAQFSTARDMAIVAKAVDTWPEIREMIRLKTFDFARPDGSTTRLTNTNRVMHSYEYCDGMKTGYTNAAGYCLISSGEREGRRRIVIIMNGLRGGIWTDSRALLEWSLKG